MGDTEPTQHLSQTRLARGHDKVAGMGRHTRRTEKAEMHGRNTYIEHPLVQ